MSIIVKGLKEIAIDKLDLPGDMKSRQKTENVKHLQMSIGQIGMLHYPKVKMPGYHVLTGGDRIAALMRSGEKKVIVELVECDAEDAVKITTHENLARRHDPKKTGEQILAALKAEEKRLEPEAAKRKATETGKGNGKGRSKTAKGLARESVARTRGVKPESVRRAEQRHRERQQAPATIEPAKPAAPSNFDMLGIELTAEYARDIGEIVRHMETAAQRIAQALAALTLLRQSSLPIDEQVIVGIWDGIHGIGETLRGAIPSKLCPWCKGQEGFQQDCAACQGNGYVTRVVRDEDIPAELRDKKKPKVAVRGKYVLLAEVAPPEEDDDPLGMRS